VVQIYANNASQIGALSFPYNSSSVAAAKWLNPIEDNIYLAGDALRQLNRNQRKLNRLQ